MTTIVKSDHCLQCYSLFAYVLTNCLEIASHGSLLETFLAYVISELQGSDYIYDKSDAFTSPNQIDTYLRQYFCFTKQYFVLQNLSKRKLHEYLNLIFITECISVWWFHCAITFVLDLTGCSTYQISHMLGMVRFYKTTYLIQAISAKTCTLTGIRRQGGSASIDRCKVAGIFRW